MSVLRIILAIPFFLVGAYLALVSMLIGCTNIATSPNGGFLLLTGLPTSVGEYVIGLIGMVLFGIGYAIATAGR